MDLNWSMRVGRVRSFLCAKRTRLTTLDTMCLYGLTNYGDSVDDEWLIVYILKELSKRFPELWVKVVDSDGEFLLIEAANALPRWMNPEIADNRVNTLLRSIYNRRAN